MKHFMGVALLELVANKLWKSQNTGPVIFIANNLKSAYCVTLHSSKDFDTVHVKQVV